MDYKKIVLNGFQNSNLLTEEKNIIRAEIPQVLEELDTRLGLQTIDFVVKGIYDTDEIPQQYIYKIFCKYGEDGIVNMKFPGALKQIEEILKDGDETIQVEHLNWGILITVTI